MYWRTPKQGQKPELLKVIKIIILFKRIEIFDDRTILFDK